MAHQNTIWAVLGGGNGGQSAAGHLGMLGYRVRLYDIFEESVQVINKQKGIFVEGAIQGFGPVELATTDLGQAVEGADIIMVIAPATAHREIAGKLAEHIREGQIVFVHPGATLGALEFLQVFIQHGIKRDSITICEAQSLLYATRLVTHGRVSIKGIKSSLEVGCIPVSKTNETISILSAAFKQIKPARNVLETSLSNLNAVMHPTPSLLCTALIESKWDWKYYMDGITPSIGALIEKLDRERVAIAKTIGLDLPDVKSMYKIMYEIEAPTLSETVRLNKAYWEIAGQKRLDTRYVLEDIPTGLVPMIEIADKFGVPCPIMKTIVSLGNYLLDRDLISTGRTLKNLGLDTLSQKEFLEYIC